MTIEAKLGIHAMVEEAMAEVETVAVEEAIDLSTREDVTVVDLRDVRELQREGKVPGAFHMPRGMLEFWIDPDSPYFKELFNQEHRFVFYCNKGWRSALATQTAQRMGLERVSHIGGGFEAWREAGGPVEEVAKK